MKIIFVFIYLVSGFFLSGCVGNKVTKTDFFNFKTEETDSLWSDRKKNLKDIKEKKESTETNTTGCQVVSPKEVIYDIPLETNGKVKKFIHYYQTIDKKWFILSLNKSTKYIPMMQEIFKEKDLPCDLVYLALIESGFSPWAYSSAGAAGIWQFIKGTGKKYGLTINWWIDERRDPQKSTIAAANYLKDLYDLFGSWPLALASYNCGEGLVKRAIKKQGTKNFWLLKLPQETKDFVPRYMAARTIAKNPGKYGFFPCYEEPLQCEEIVLKEPVDLRIVARCSDSTYLKLKRLNPALKRRVTPSNYPDYKLKIPVGSKERFETCFAKIPFHKRVVWQKHQVKRGETLWEIARRYETTIPVIMDLNSLQSSHWIRDGWNLIIPTGIRN